MRRYYKSYLRCAESELIVGKFDIDANTVESGYTFNGMVDGSSYATPPGWFTQSNPFPLGDTFWIIDSNSATSGVYYFSWTGLSTGIEYLVKFTKLSACQDVLSLANCRNQRTLTWLNREGGWSVFIFTGKSTKEVDVTDIEKYITPDFITRAQSRDGVYQAEVLTTGNIPQVALDLMESLKSSNQIYLVQDKDLGVEYVPVFTNADNFVKQKTGDKKFDVTVRIVYATEVKIQTG